MTSMGVARWIAGGISSGKTRCPGRPPTVFTGICRGGSHWKPGSCVAARKLHIIRPASQCSSSSSTSQGWGSCPPSPPNPPAPTSPTPTSGGSSYASCPPARRLDPSLHINFSIEDSAMILIDHQCGTIQWASSTPLELLKKNIIILAKLAKGTNMPLILTTSQETNVTVQGPLIPELQAAAPDEFCRRIKRTGIVNAWDDPAFAEACRRTCRKNFIMAGNRCSREGADGTRYGEVTWEDPCVRLAKAAHALQVTTDVCMVAPAISALSEGFNVKVVADACGSTNQIAEKVSWRRMDRAGIHLTSTNAIVGELVKNWTSPAGTVAFPLLA